VIVDSSALVAIITAEPEHERLLAALASDGRPPGVGAPSLLETGIVLTWRFGDAGQIAVERFCREAGVVAIPFDDEHWPVALAAFRRFGKGRHPASLNLGDCLTYAVAVLADEPLLFVGDDFTHTDVVAAEW
jgi:ribonuclease VapC